MYLDVPTFLLTSLHVCTCKHHIPTTPCCLPQSSTHFYVPRPSTLHSHSNIFVSTTTTYSYQQDDKMDPACRMFPVLTFDRLASTNLSHKADSSSRPIREFIVDSAFDLPHDALPFKIALKSSSPVQPDTIPSGKNIRLVHELVVSLPDPPPSILSLIQLRTGFQYPEHQHPNSHPRHGTHPFLLLFQNPQ